MKTKTSDIYFSEKWKNVALLFFLLFTRSNSIEEQSVNDTAFFDVTLNASFAPSFQNLLSNATTNAPTPRPTISTPSIISENFTQVLIGTNLKPMTSAQEIGYEVIQRLNTASYSPIGGEPFVQTSCVVILQVFEDSNSNSTFLNQTTQDHPSNNNSKKESLQSLSNSINVTSTDNRLKVSFQITWTSRYSMLNESEFIDGFLEYHNQLETRNQMISSYVNIGILVENVSNTIVYQNFTASYQEKKPSFGPSSLASFLVMSIEEKNPAAIHSINPTMTPTVNSADASFSQQPPPPLNSPENGDPSDSGPYQSWIYPTVIIPSIIVLGILIIITKKAVLVRNQGIKKRREIWNRESFFYHPNDDALFYHKSQKLQDSHHDSTVFKTYSMSDDHENSISLIVSDHESCSNININNQYLNDVIFRASTISDELDTYKDPSIEEIRHSVNSKLMHCDNILSRAMTYALLKEEEQVQVEHVQKYGKGFIKETVMEAGILCDVNEWMKRNELADIQERKVFLEQIMSQMIVSVIYRYLSTPKFSLVLLECAAMLRLPVLIEVVPQNLILITGLRKNVEMEQIRHVFKKFGVLEYAAVAPKSRGFGIVRYAAVHTAQKVIETYKRREIVVQDVAVSVQRIPLLYHHPISLESKEPFSNSTINYRRLKQQRSIKDIGNRVALHRRVESEPSNTNSRSLVSFMKMHRRNSSLGDISSSVSYI